MSCDTFFKIEIGSGAETFQERLEIIRKEIRKIQSTPNVVGDEVLLKIFSRLPVPVFNRIPLTSWEFIISNVPGPSRVVSLWENEMEDVNFWLRASCTYNPNYHAFRQLKWRAPSGAKTLIHGQEQLNEITRNIQFQLEEMKRMADCVEVSASVEEDANDECPA